MKTCRKCNKEKEDDLFIKKREELTNLCKQCHSNRVNESQKAKRKKRGLKQPGPPPKETELLNITKKCTKCKLEKDLSLFARKNGGKDYRAICKVCKNVDDYRSRLQQPGFKIKRAMKSSIHKAVVHKIQTTSAYVGCTTDFLILWLEWQFNEYMSWDNYGTYWNIDHVIPISAFDLSNPKEYEICLHWRNLQPLKKIDNFTKSNKIAGFQIMNSIITVCRFININGLDVKEYQGVRATLHWLREELRYGKNLSDDISTKVLIEMVNPQPSFLSKVHNDLKELLRRRLND